MSDNLPDDVLAHVSLQALTRLINARRHMRETLDHILIATTLDEAKSAARRSRQFVDDLEAGE